MAEQPTADADPRVGLAEDRTHMANLRTSLALDRTMLAWLRTNLTMATFGFGLVGFFRSARQANPSAEMARLHEGAINFGIWLMVLGIAATVFAGVAHLATLRRLRRREAPVLTHWPLSVMVAFLVALGGLVGLWSVLSR